MTATEGVLRHEAVSLRLRAPRVAIVVPDDEIWRFTAQVALHRAATIWGGAGFVLVPHKDGNVSRHMRRLLAAYDPDHVVTVSAPALDLLEARGKTEVHLSDGTPKRLDELREDGVSWRSTLSNKDEVAQDNASRACSPYRDDFIVDEDGQHVRDHLTGLVAGNEGRNFLNVEPGSTEGLPDLGWNDAESRDIALIVASKWGLAAPPSPRTSVVPSADELEGIKRSIVEQLGERSGRGPESHPLSAWKASLRGLVNIFSPDSAHLGFLVVGSTLEDFSLAHLLDRLYGNTIWLPEEWLSEDSSLHRLAAKQIFELSWRRHTRALTVRLLSTSADVDALHAQLTSGAFLAASVEGPGWIERSALNEISLGRGGHLALANDFYRDVAVPVYAHPGGETILATRLPLTLPETDEVLAPPVPEWHIDVDLRSAAMPRTRGLPGSALRQDTGSWPERVRSGRDGISVMSRSFGFVPAGATLAQQVARPSLRVPGLMRWMQEMVARDGVTVQVSDAGHAADVAAKLWGDRARMADDMRDYFPLFAEFQCEGRPKTTDRYPDDDGSVLRGEGYLTFSAASRVLSGTLESGEKIRDVLDKLTQRSVLRRGVIVRCLVCTHVQWVSITQLDRTFPCERCMERVPLTREAWNQPTEEPRWFYDLHPVVRALMASNGDVPVLAGRYVQTADRWANTEVLPEVVFSENGKRVFEIDLVAGSRERVTIAECKDSPTIKSSERSRKLVALTRAATFLRADVVLLAAGQGGEWDTGFVEGLRKRLAEVDRPDGGQPSVQLLTALRSDPVVQGEGTATGS